ncbi:uncharacterized protein LOC62_03G004333 [Vanrija pseudolonga]|uniref:Uncharacterized protein n=1 Tax=Vanrija pseudolonga TaxID=143232 RepID=A0AAF1BLF5_9TREE|nr:hypothetical protein LOC62_03G004333 [Vanrija pseudolonga]
MSSNSDKDDGSNAVLTPPQVVADNDAPATPAAAPAAPSTPPPTTARRGPPMALQLPSLPLTGSALDLPSLAHAEADDAGTQAEDSVPPTPAAALPTRTLSLPALRALAARGGDFTHFPSVSLHPSPTRRTVISHVVPVAPGFLPSTSPEDVAGVTSAASLLFGPDLAAALVVRLAEAGARPGSPIASSPRKGSAAGVPEAWWAGLPSIRAAAHGALFGLQQDEGDEMAPVVWDGGEFAVVDGRGGVFAFSPPFGDAELEGVMELVAARAAAAVAPAPPPARESELDAAFAGFSLAPRASAELLAAPPASPTKPSSAVTSPRSSAELLRTPAPPSPTKPAATPRSSSELLRHNNNPPSSPTKPAASPAGPSPRASTELLRSSTELLRSPALPPSTTAKVADADDPDTPQPPSSPRQRRSTLGGISFLSLGAAVGIGRKKK